LPGGADAQVGFKTEVTPGTAVTVDKFLPFLSDEIEQQIEYMDTQTLGARHTTTATKQGKRTVAGPLKTELGNTTLATLLKHMFGTIVTTGAGPYTHTASPGPLTGKSMTIQGGRPMIDGTVQPFTYAGCKFPGWTLAVNVGELAKLDLDIIGMTETTATALAVASFDTSWAPFTFVESSLNIAGSAPNNVRSMSLTAVNQVGGRWGLGSATSKEPLQAGKRPYTGTVVIDFESLTAYNRFVNGTQAAMVDTFSNGTQTLVITKNVVFTGKTPGVKGFDLLAQELPYRCLSATSDAAAITAVLTNSESSSA